MVSQIKSRQLRPDNYSLQARRKNKTIEHKLQKNIIEYLLFLKFVVIRHNSSSFKNGDRFVRSYIIENTGESSGLSDLQIMKNGKCAFLEIKKDEKTQLSKKQKEVKELFENAEIPYYKIGSFEDLKPVLNYFQKS